MKGKGVKKGAGIKVVVVGDLFCSWESRYCEEEKKGERYGKVVAKVVKVSIRIP